MENVLALKAQACYTVFRKKEEEKGMTKTKALSVRETALCGLFAALTAAGAFIRIDLPVQPFPMHFTLQIFFALLSGFILGPRLGAVSVGIYLAVGLVGIPVFAAGGGPAYLIRPTFGFLLGFLFAAWLAGKISRMGRRTSLARNICAAVVGMGAYYLSGVLYFYFISNYVISMPVTWALVLVNCFILTAAGDLVLSILAAMLAVRLRAAVDFM